MAVRRKTQLLHVVNRTTGKLSCMWDGIPYVIYPGYLALNAEGVQVDEVTVDDRGRVPKGITIVPAKAVRDKRGIVTGIVPNLEEDAPPYSEQFEWAVARAACLQNKKHETENPHDPREFESLCGVLEWDNDITHTEQVDGEAIDRSMLGGDAQGVRRIGTSQRSAKTKARRRFQIESYGGGAGNPTGMYIGDKHL